MSRRMIAWTFEARWPDGRMEHVDFYARTRAEAEAIARAWAERAGCELVEEGER